MTKYEVNAAVCLGCLAGAGLAGMLWILAEIVVATEHALPGAGWVLAGLITLILAGVIRDGIRSANAKFAAWTDEMNAQHPTSNIQQPSGEANEA